MRLPETIAIDEDVQIGGDTVILPYSQLSGRTVVGSACVIGPPRQSSAAGSATVSPSGHRR